VPSLACSTLVSCVTSSPLQLTRSWLDTYGPSVAGLGAVINTTNGAASSQSWYTGASTTGSWSSDALSYSKSSPSSATVPTVVYAAVRSSAEPCTNLCLKNSFAYTGAVAAQVAVNNTALPSTLSSTSDIESEWLVGEQQGGEGVWRGDGPSHVKATPSPFSTQVLWGYCSL
jgi:hypothetical protein